MCPQHVYERGAVKLVKLVMGKEDIASSGGSLGASIFNLSNTTLGAGIVAIPFFFSQCGYMLGTLILIAVGIASACASYFLVAAAEYSGQWSYIAVAGAAYGQRGQAAVQVAILCLTIGVMSAFYVQLGETGSQTLSSLVSGSSHWWTSPLLIKAVFTGLPLLPLTLQRDLSSLAGASLFVLGALIYLVVVVIAMGSGDGGAGCDDDDGDNDDGAAADDDDEYSVSVLRIGPSFFTAVPIAVLAFGNQVNIHQVITELKDPTPRRRAAVICVTNIVVLLIYAAIGIAGYTRFGDSGTKDNILSNYCELGRGFKLVAFTVARFGIVGVVLCSYPMLLFPCRNCFHFILTKGHPDRYSIALPSSELSLDSAAPHQNGLSDTVIFHFRLPFGLELQLSNEQLFVTETLAIMGTTFFIAWLVPSLSVIMGFTGAIMGTLLGFIFPAIYFLKLIPAAAADATAVTISPVATLSPTPLLEEQLSTTDEKQREDNETDSVTALLKPNTTAGSRSGGCRPALPLERFNGHASMVCQCVCAVTKVRVCCHPSKNAF